MVDCWAQNNYALFLIFSLLPRPAGVSRALAVSLRRSEPDPYGKGDIPLFLNERAPPVLKVTDGKRGMSPFPRDSSESRFLI